MLVRELFALYAHGGDTAGLPPVTPYREYLAWVATQDPAVCGRGLARGTGGSRQGDATWRRGMRRGRAGAPEEFQLTLGPALTTALSQGARASGRRR